MNGKCAKRIRWAALASSPITYRQLKQEYKQLPYHRRPKMVGIPYPFPSHKERIKQRKRTMKVKYETRNRTR